MRFAQHIPLLADCNAHVEHVQQKINAKLRTGQGQYTCQGATPALSRSMGSKTFSSWLMMKTGWPRATSSPKLATYAGSTPQVSLNRSASGCKGSTHCHSSPD